MKQETKIRPRTEHTENLTEKKPINPLKYFILHISTLFLKYFNFI